MLGEGVGRHKAHHAVIAALLPVRAEKHDRRRADDAEMLVQRLVLRIVGGDIGLQQHHVRQRRLHCRVGEGFSFHFLAAHTPVGVEIEHHRLAGLPGLLQFAFEAVDALDWDEGEMRRRVFGAGGGRAAKALQRLQQAAVAGAQPQQHDQATGEQQQPQAFPQLAPAGRALGQGVDRAHVHRRHDHQRGPQEQGEGGGGDPFEQPDRQRQQEHAEHRLDRIHPGAGARQQGAGRGADQQQRRAHAQAERKQRHAAEHGVAGIGNIDERAHQRRGDAGADDQRREKAHDGHAHQIAALLAVADLGELALDGGRHLQLIEAEHGEGEGDENQGKGADDPRILEPGLNVFPRQAHQHADDGVGERHRQYIHQRQHKGLAGGDCLALANDDAGEDGDHREHAGGEGQQQAGAEEDQQGEQGVAAFQRIGDGVLFAFGAGLLRRWLSGRGAAGVDGVGRGHHRARLQMQLEGLVLRRVADAGHFRAALIGHLEGHVLALFAGPGVGQGGAGEVVVDVQGLVEHRVVLGFAGRLDQLAGLYILVVDRDFDLVAVEIVPLGDHPFGGEGARLLPGAELKGLIRVENIVVTAQAVEQIEVVAGKQW